MSDAKPEKTEKHRRYLPDNAPPRPENPIIEKYAWRKMWLENNNTLWTIVGDTGDGKSYASLRLGEIIDQDFSIDNVAFSITEFLEMAMDKSAPQGSVIVLEEASVEASAYDWYSASNRIFAKVLDTWRHQNRMGIINLPNFMALEKGARRRTEAIVQMQHAAPWRDYSQAKFKEVKYDTIEDNLTTPFPITRGKQRKHLRFKLPSKELRDAYEDRKENYTTDLNKELLDELLEDEEGEAGGLDDPADIADAIIDDDVSRYIMDAHGIPTFDKSLVEVDYGVGPAKSKRVKSAIRSKCDEEFQ